MQIAEPVGASWRAELALRFESRAAKTVLASRRHDGPLVVQKPLYPEGEAVCHAIVVHPPAGIAGGDELDIRLDAASGAHALLTTPGAGKWYRSAGPWARQSIAIHVEESAMLEWLPQEAIVFDGALARLETQIDLSGDARFLGWEILCFGRSGSGERFERGECRVATTIRRDGRLLWLERGRIDGGGRLMHSEAGLGGHSVCATMLACAPGLDASALARCRVVEDAALTLLPGVLVARHLGDSSELAKRSFARLWSLLRPLLCGREAIEPRIWRT